MRNKIFFLFAAAVIAACSQKREPKFNGYSITGIESKSGSKVISVIADDRIKTGVLDSITSLINLTFGQGKSTNINYYLKDAGNEMAWCSYSYEYVKFQNRTFYGMTYESFVETEKEMNDQGFYMLFENTSGNGSVVGFDLTEKPQIVIKYPNSELEQYTLKPEMIAKELYYRSDDESFLVNQEDSILTIKKAGGFEVEKYKKRSRPLMVLNSLNTKEKYN